MEPLQIYQASADALRKVASHITPDQLGLPSPCAGWDVRRLLEHLTEGNRTFAAAAGKVGIEPGLPAGESDHVAAFEDSARALDEALSDRSVLERTWDLPFGAMPGAAAINLAIMENLLHGWDLAKATGQTMDAADDLVEPVLAVAKEVPQDQARRPGVWSSEVAIADDAPAIDRLAAYTGRQP